MAASGGGSGLWWGNANRVIGDGNTNTKYIALLTSSTEAMRIVSTGYVGIGTTAPSRALDVSGSANVSTNLGANTMTAVSWMQIANTSAASLFFGTSNNNLIRGSDTSGYVSVYTSGTEAMRIVSTGYVGIGTSTPNAKLEIVGDVSGSGRFVSTPASTYDGTAQIAASNPLNSAANFYMGWISNTARLRIGGTGAGANNGLDIQGRPTSP
ncbi:hypothetical protein [Bradyrhizobium sp. CCGE-LA001]|uniref:hypothetical protein n=1 Tax=Bradyrhizobium sp. CCGE-LA001 TaxID=1223566 RepID=UPI000745E11F|nr:hypothetical protein [Bradyrhizobium sp. CCGE-LA001]AMA60139.1 hypothetical protein BCCGELA001_30510 [Bradyrhizobium sp. CCGE-LA001]